MTVESSHCSPHPFDYLIRDSACVRRDTCSPLERQGKKNDNKAKWLVNRLE